MVPRAFTLTELLTATAIVAIIAAVLFPVFAQAKAASRRVACITRYRQIGLAAFQYVQDYDERVMTVEIDEGRTWVQQITPYMRSFRMFRCQEDPYNPFKQLEDADPEVILNLERYQREASMRASAGLNFQYLSPVVRVRGKWTPSPLSMSVVADPARTLFMIESAWSVNRNGRSEEGGSWLVEPPCRFVARGRQRFDTFSEPGAQRYTRGNGWGRNKPSRYGGVFPWHNGAAISLYTDGSVKTMKMEQITRGCEPRNDWRGVISDQDAYPWDTGAITGSEPGFDP